MAEPQPLRLRPDPAGGAYKTASPQSRDLLAVIGERWERGEKERGTVELERGVENFKQGLACIDEPLNHCMVCAQGL